ncbi:MAG TPA: ATP-dependent RNA helicase HrpA, partial [Phycisphaerales bacterium]|nr:ATP-dependent RNA helicase HrpA [Phycisphaerales bacterium]
MTETFPTLPILLRRAEIEAAIRAHQVVVICGETGSGKTTQLPQICFELGLAERGLIGHTQPRRRAARAVAARLAAERSVRLGGLVGVKVRFQDTTSRETRIKLLTDGMLLAEMSGGDPQLRAYSTIIIDEAHERSLNIDLLLGYLRSLLPKRPDLKLIITSATIDPHRFANYFSPAAPSLPPVIEVSGRSYPVQVRYHPYKDDEDEPERIEVEHVADAVEELLLAGPRLDASTPSSAQGILVFLPGEREIRMAADALRRRQVAAEVLPLFSRLTNQEQDRIFHPGDRPRIILSTNVAETSLTVPGIRCVVDTGLARLNRYDPQRKIGRLPIEPISRASANQRAGRCGRLGPGICIRLYSEDSYKARPAFTDPEIRRTSLASVILQMKALKVGAIEDFPFLDAPDAAAIKDGYETLFELGAITGWHGQLAARGETPDITLTPLGQQLARIPVDPRIARMLLAARDEDVIEEVVILAAVLSIQDPRDRPLARQQDADRAHAVFREGAGAGGETSDFLTLLNIYDQARHAAETLGSGAFIGWCRDHFLSPARLREWKEIVHQLRDIVADLDEDAPRPRLSHPPSDIRHPPSTRLHRALLTGLISNVACREGDGSFDYRGVRGNVVQIFPGSVLFKKGPKWIMAAEIVQTTRLYARTLAKIDAEWIEELAGHMFRRQLSDPHLDAETGQPSAWERLTMSGIVVVPRRRAALAPIDPKKARDIFLREALAEAKWSPTPLPPFIEHNRRTLASAASLEARLRRRNLVRPPDEIAAWFAERVPDNITEPAAFNRWRESAEKTTPRILMLDLADALKPEALAAIDPAAFPDDLTLANGEKAALTYALAPGKDADGLTATISLRNLPHLTPDRAQWLIPGMLPDLIAALIRNLPKPQRSAIESKGDPQATAANLAEVLDFARGSLPASLSEALEVLHGVKIDPNAWSFSGLPAYLRLRIHVIDDTNPTAKPIDEDRDLPALLKRLEPRLKKLRASEDKAAFDRHNLTTWSFGDLPDHITTERDGAETKAYPMLLDAGAGVSLTLAATQEQAALETPRGLRRLFALACADEVRHYLESHPAWHAMTGQYTQLGTTDELRDQLTLVIAERTFLDNQPSIRTRSDYEDRLAASWGRLSTISRETCDAVARILDARAQVARRFSGGTPRLWAASVADIREQAAYLYPRGFLALVGWDRLRRYPIYAEVMRERLFTLREEGFGTETASLNALAPHWKRFTAWVAAAMAAQSGDADDSDAARNPPRSAKSKAPLPQARRAAPKV